MGTIAELSENPQLTRANALILNGAAIVQKSLVPVNGKISKYTLECADQCLQKLLKADAAMARADYREVDSLLDWATDDTAALPLTRHYFNDLLASLPPEGGSSRLLMHTDEKLLAVVVFATGKDAQKVADLYGDFDSGTT